MSSLVQNYENIIIVNTKLAEENIKKVVEKFKDLISKHAKLIDVQELGKRRLAYPINYETEGYYVIFTFESNPDFPAELARNYRIDDSIMRFMTTVKEVEDKKSSVKNKVSLSE